MTNHPTSLWKRLLSFAIVLAMVLSLAACTSDPVVTTGPQSAATQGTTVPPTTVQPTTNPATQPTTAPTVPETTAPTEPERSKELEFTLTQEAVDEFYQLLDACEALSLLGEDMDAIDASVIALDESFEYLDEQCSIAMILHYAQTKNEELEQQYLDTVEIRTDASDAYLQMARRIYLSDSPAKDSLFEDWTQEEIDSLLAYDEEIANLQQRNAEIGVEYRAETNDEAKIKLYIEFIKNNNKIAKFYGYDNYYTYAYERVYDRDYGVEELEQMRQYAKTDLKNLFNIAYSNFYNSYYSRLTSKEQQDVQKFLYSNYNTLSRDYIGVYMDAVPESLADALHDMLKYDSLFTSASDAMQGAFTTMVGDRSYCYFGTGYWNANTVIHEGGHYYASLYSNLGSIPLDLAEVHSQANEWLFYTSLKKNISANVRHALVDYKIYNDLAMAMICLMVDEFEQRVYSTNLKGFKAKDFDAIMDEIAREYFPNGDVGEQLADVNHYWRQVVVDQPIYYISYAVSGFAALSLFAVADKDFDAAIAMYQKLCEEPVLEAGFLGNLRSVGIPNPFDEEFYTALKSLINGRIR